MKNYKRINILLGWFTFAVSAVVYLMTTEPSASLWDCGEFIPTSYKLEVGHPPGAPLFMMLARLFTMLAVDTAHVAFMANAMSCIAAALTIMFLFWVITHLGRRLTGKRLEELSAGQFWTVMGAGLVGGEGFIMQKVTGPGMAFFEFDGYCPEYDLAAGEELVCDTGVLAMMDETCTMDVRMVKGAKNLLLGGEGLVDTVITGPGKVYLQTMTVANIAKLIIPFIPEKK